MVRRNREKEARRYSDGPWLEETAQVEAGSNAYAEGVQAGHRVDARLQKIIGGVIALFVLYVVGLLVPQHLFDEALHTTGYGAGYTFSWFVGDLMENVAGLMTVLSGQGADTAFASSMIRYLVIAASGAGLAVCGAVYQGSFKNALVSPSTLGVMSGATAGMLLWIVFFVDEDASNVEWLVEGGSSDMGIGEYLVSTYSLSLLSFAGCVLVVGIVLLVVKLVGKGGANGIFLIVTGQVIGSIVGAVGNSVRYYYLSGNPYGPKASLLTDLQIASFYRPYTWIDLVAIGVPLVATVVVVMVLRRRMTALQLSEAEARTLGVNSRAMQICVVGLCTLLTAIIVSFCGSVGFVGFLVPRLARRIVGPNFAYLLPAALVFGALFVLGAYVLVMTLLGAEYETMVGMYISIGGAVVFLVTALRGKGAARGRFE